MTFWRLLILRPSQNSGSKVAHEEANETRRKSALGDGRDAGDATRGEHAEEAGTGPRQCRCDQHLHAHPVGQPQCRPDCPRAESRFSAVSAEEALLRRPPVREKPCDERPQGALGEGLLELQLFEVCEPERCPAESVAPWTGSTVRYWRAPRRSEKTPRGPQLRQGCRPPFQTSIFTMFWMIMKPMNIMIPGEDEEDQTGRADS